jgi:hypothetical protein
VRQAFFPLDEQLELLPGSLTPHAHECLVRLGAWLPSFEQAAKLLEGILGVRISEATSRRQTEAAGAAYEALHQQQVQQLEREVPPAPVGASKLQLSADGAMIPLVGGQWAEVKTVAIGEVEQKLQPDGTPQVQTQNISYFSRMLEVGEFSRQALVEVQRRGIEHAQLVAAPADGSEWIQSLVDFHCPSAIRILHFPHAAERISQIGQALFEPAEAQAWLEQRLHQLKHEGPTQLLSELEDLHLQQPNLTILAENLAYLRKREAQMDYPTFQRLGLPIGSGIVESAHKVVVEARLKGAGMHWAPEHLNPMVALRNLVCNDRWEEDWPKIVAQLRLQAAQRRQRLRDQRASQKQPQGLPLSPVKPPVLPSPPAPEPSPASPNSSGPYRPAPNHPWRRSPIGRARFQPSSPLTFSKN